MDEAALSAFRGAQHLHDEAAHLEAMTALLGAPLGSAAALDAAEEARLALRSEARDLAELRRQTADLLSSVGRIAVRSVDSRREATAGDGGHGWDAVAAELESLSTPAALSYDRDLRLPALEAGLLALAPPIGAYLLWRAAQDTLGPAPRVRAVTSAGEEQADGAAARLNASRPATVSDAIAACALVDAMGLKDSAVVDVARITHANGEETWVVTLPSTQDWVVPDGDTPAPNDLDAILAQALLGGAPSTYRRGVEEVVRQAGIPAGAPVLVVGFSLGGMLAADLARTGLGKPSVEGVIAAGSPIDMADDPAGVQVLSLTHDGDLVPRLDLAPEGDGAMRTTVADEAAPSAAPHSASAYAATAQAHDEDGSLSAPFARLLAEEGAKVEHRQYEITER